MKGGSMPGGSSAESLAQQARFVFKGTIQKLKATNMSEVAVNDRTVIVRVDEVLQAPESLKHYAGAEITVQLGGRKKVKRGQQAVFYTNPFLYGDTLAVQSLDHEPGEGLVGSMAGGDQPVTNMANRDTQQRFDKADVVVSGKVVAVRLPPESTAVGFGSAAPTAAEPISEHAPLWREAVIHVQAVHKGT